MGELPNAAQRLRIAVLGLEHDARAQRRHQSALPRNSELRGELAAGAGDDLGLNNLVVHTSFVLSLAKVHKFLNIEIRSEKWIVWRIIRSEKWVIQQFIRSEKWVENILKYCIFARSKIFRYVTT
jgi:hypothetical protein